VLETAILGVLSDGSLHGYELKKRITDVIGPWSSVSFGSLYPALSRLERAGHVVVDDAVAPAAPPMPSLGAEVAAFRARTRSRRRVAVAARPQGVLDHRWRQQPPRGPARRSRRRRSFLRRSRRLLSTPVAGTTDQPVRSSPALARSHGR
jgi:hypothetical protein